MAKTAKDIQFAIAMELCERFLGQRQSMRRHDILIEFENPDLLDEMERRGLALRSPNSPEYLPSAGTFALLGKEHPLCAQARSAFEKTIPILWNLYRRDGVGVTYTTAELRERGAKFVEDHTTQQTIDLGVYLCQQFAVFSTWKHNEDRTAIESFVLAESVIKMRDPAPWWEQRARVALEGPPQMAATMMETPCPPETTDFDLNSFWSLINPAVVEEAMPRFNAGHYADAVAAALKVVARAVRNKTGLTDDGAALMLKAFSTKKPYLVFVDPIPETRDALQVGYMQIFAGTMTGVRNPKAHGLVDIDARRCIHFLFLASLLADKIEEAQPVQPDGEVRHEK